MNRRSLLKALPAAVVAGAAPAAALCIADPAETPVMRLFREWEAAVAAHGAMSDDQHEASDEAYSQICDIESEMLREPCQTAQDFTAKIIAWTGEGVHTLPDATDNPGLWAEARALVA